jgi:hypothetical protein
MGGFKNGALLKLIEREAFEIFLTGDKNMDNQQQLEGRPFAVLVMSAINWPVEVLQEKVRAEQTLQKIPASISVIFIALPSE